MIKKIAKEKNFQTILNNIDIISVSKDKHRFYRDILDYISESEEGMTVLIYLLNNGLNQATLAAERNLFSSHIRKFLVIKSDNKTLWEVIGKNRIKVYRDLPNNEDVDVEIKSLEKSTAFGVPINTDDDITIGAIWIFSNDVSKDVNDYCKLKNALEKISREVAVKEENNIMMEGLH